jgi:hypothetical protein
MCCMIIWQVRVSQFHVNKENVTSLWFFKIPQWVALYSSYYAESYFRVGYRLRSRSYSILMKTEARRALAICQIEPECKKLYLFTVFYSYPLWKNIHTEKFHSIALLTRKIIRGFCVLENSSHNFTENPMAVKTLNEPNMGAFKLTFY